MALYYRDRNHTGLANDQIGLLLVVQTSVSTESDYEMALLHWSLRLHRSLCRRNLPRYFYMRSGAEELQSENTGSLSAQSSRRIHNGYL